MTRCPVCGTAMAEGAAYCANPACGAVPGQAPGPAGPLKTGKSPEPGAGMNFVALARTAAFIIAGLAFAYLFFSVKPAR